MCFFRVLFQAVIVLDYHLGHLECSDFSVHGKFVSYKKGLYRPGSTAAVTAVGPISVIIQFSAKPQFVQQGLQGLDFLPYLFLLT